jgi:hypothetical protein
MESPAASADVHPAGRRALESMAQIAPDPAVGAPPFQSASNSSYSVQVSLLTMMAWRSLPPSMVMSGPKGYGPGSLSSA